MTTATTINIVIFLGVITIALFFSVRQAAVLYGPEVSERFLEGKPTYSVDSLSNWIEQHSKAVRGYAVPVLFPLDLMFMIFLGAFIGFGSVISAESVHVIQKWAWCAAVLPAVYVAFDLIEDTFLVRMLLNRASITEGLVSWTKLANNLKVLSCALSIFQAGFLSGIGAILTRYNTG